MLHFHDQFFIFELKSKKSEPNDQLEEAVANLEKKMSAHEGIIDKLKTPNPKSCDTILQSDSSKESGMYWIDPDGQGQGDRPIYVYCNMSTGQAI